MALRMSPTNKRDKERQLQLRREEEQDTYVMNIKRLDERTWAGILTTKVR
jgi:hypothetical protein